MKPFRMLSPFALAVVAALKETNAFSLTMTRQAVQLTKPPMFQSPPVSRRSTPLRYRNRDDEAETNVVVGRQELGTARTRSANHEQTSTTRTLRIPIVGAIAVSQVLSVTASSFLIAAVLFFTGNAVDFGQIHWNWGSEFYGLFDFSMTPVRVMEGVLATLPMVYMGTMVEQSDERDESHVNFSTMNMVMTLFGRRRGHFWETTDSTTREQSVHPDLPQASMVQVLLWVAAISVITGIAEEVVFRGEIPFVIAFFSHSPLLAWLGQAALFGLGHLSHKATPGENRVVSSLQTINGLWYGFVYLMTGGDILPCIIAHTLYDSHVFMETWMKINDQMDYTEVASHKMLSSEEQEEIQTMQAKSSDFLTDETLDFTKRFFYAFDYEHKGSLSRSDLQRAVSYAFLQDKVQPTPARVSKLFDKALRRRQKKGQGTDKELKERLRLTDFLRVLFALKGNPQRQGAAKAKVSVRSL